MKTVYTLTEQQYKQLESIVLVLARDNVALSVGHRRATCVSLTHILSDVSDTATMQVEPADRKAWVGSDRRMSDRRTDNGPLIRRSGFIALDVPGEQA